MSRKTKPRGLDADLEQRVMAAIRRRRLEHDLRPHPVAVGVWQANQEIRRRGGW